MVPVSECLSCDARRAATVHELTLSYAASETVPPNENSRPDSWTVSPAASGSTTASVGRSPMLLSRRTRLYQWEKVREPKRSMHSQGASGSVSSVSRRKWRTSAS